MLLQSQIVCIEMVFIRSDENYENDDDDNYDNDDDMRGRIALQIQSGSPV